MSDARSRLIVALDLPGRSAYHGVRSPDMRQFIYGVILGAAALYLYERFDPPALLAYLNAATESAVKSTSGYGGKDRAR